MAKERSRATVDSYSYGPYDGTAHDDLYESNGIQSSSPVSDLRMSQKTLTPTAGQRSRFPDDDLDTDEDAVPAKKKWYTRRRVLVALIIIALLGIAMLFIMLFVIVRAIAQHVINVSTIHIDRSAITNPQNASFELTMDATISHTGKIPATIHYTEPVQVSWVVDDKTEKFLGTMTLPSVIAKNSHATLNQTTTFTIENEGSFGEFAAAMITQESFKWRLKSNNLRVNAAKFPVAKGISFNKVVTIQGINNFQGNVELEEFLLPRDAPEGGIVFKATTSLVNKSPFQLDLGSTLFDLRYNGTLLGRGESRSTNIQPGVNKVTLKGRLVPQTSPSDLQRLSALFTNYINGEPSVVVAQGIAAVQSDGSTVRWLSTGLQSLQMNVPFKPVSAINPIRDINIGYFNLTFDEAHPWAPMASTDKIKATMELPFGFGVNITDIRNVFSINSNNTDVATIETPYTASASDITVLGEGKTRGTVDITIKNVQLSVPTDKHDMFSAFNEELTESRDSNFRLLGKASAKTSLSVGDITLDGIKFNVPSGLVGLQGLRNATVIKTIDVLGGTTDHILLDIGLNIFNPSNLNIGVGDLSFQLLKENSPLGTTLLPHVRLNMGNNALKATGFFKPNLNPEGKKTLSDFVGGKDTPLNIRGYDASTKIAPLVKAFESLSMTAVLPGLNASLLKSASLTVPPTIGKTNNISKVQVDFVNPFTSTLKITSIKSTISSHGLTLGSIDQSVTFPASGKSTTRSPELDLHMNLDPSQMFTLTVALAKEAGLRTDQIEAIMQLGGYHLLPTESVGRGVSKRGIFSGFDLPRFVDTAFKGLSSNVQLNSDVAIGDYATSLEYSQHAVPVVTGPSLHFLLPTLAQPIVQKIVAGSELSIDTVTITDVREESFVAKLKGAITNAGPFDAKISFGSGLAISWGEQLLGRLELPEVTVVADQGASIESSSVFHVADVGRLAQFTKTLLLEKSFSWQISGDNLTVEALGMSVSGISLPPKTVVLEGMGGLSDSVVIDSFDLPGDDPAGGIHLTLDTTIRNPSQVGIALSSIGFDTYIGPTYLGPVSSARSFTIEPKATSRLPLAGRLIPQTTSQGLADVSTMFNDFIHDKNSTVSVQGTSATSNGATWLNDGIKSLKITTVLPSRGILELITAINIEDLGLEMTSKDQEFSPVASSKKTIATYRNPFGFSLQAIESEENLVVAFNGADAAELKLARASVQGAVSKGNPAPLQLAFSGQTLRSLNDEAFAAFFKAVTTSAQVSTRFHGIANVLTKTPIGNVALSDISFDVTSTLQGINSFNHQASLSGVKLTGSGGDGGSQFIVSPLTATLENPSTISLKTQAISLPVFYKDVQIGRSLLDPFNLVPGSNTFSNAIFRYMPADDNSTIAQEFLARFIQTGEDIPLTIKGDSQSSPLRSLQPALEAVSISASLRGSGSVLVTNVEVVISASTLITSRVVVNFDVHNPFDTDLTIDFVQSDSGLNGVTYAQFAHSFDNFVVPAHGTVNSGKIPDVLLTQGVVKSLLIVPEKKLDLFYSQIAHVGNHAGYRIPWVQLQQSSVPTTYTITI